MPPFLLSEKVHVGPGTPILQCDGSMRALNMIWILILMTNQITVTNSELYNPHWNHFILPLSDKELELPCLFLLEPFLSEVGFSVYGLVDRDFLSSSTFWGEITVCESITLNHSIAFTHHNVSFKGSKGVIYPLNWALLGIFLGKINPYTQPSLIYPFCSPPTSPLKLDIQWLSYIQDFMTSWLMAIKG